MTDKPADAAARRRRPDQLVAGPHRMSREQVAANQTARILSAMRELIADHGYERTTVDVVIRKAGVSRRTFYELCGGREQWFVAICAAAGDRLLARIDATREQGSRDQQARRAAAALVDFCLDDPVEARTCFVETLAASEQTRAWRDGLLDELAQRIAAGTPASDGDRRPELAARAAVGAVLELASRQPELVDRAHATRLIAAMLADVGTNGAAA
jgi:AcrR family transcriptional regulator